MPQSKRQLCPGIAILAISLMLLIPACATTPKIEVVHEIPDLTFPVFPPPDPVTFDQETGLVSMPLWYWKDIAEYKIDVDAIEEYISRVRELQKTMEK